MIYKDPVTTTEIEVPGVILATMKNTLKTEGVIVEALLGQGNALDNYSHGLQREAVRQRILENEDRDADTDWERLAQKLVEKGDSKEVDRYVKIYHDSKGKDSNRLKEKNKGNQ